MQRGPRHRAHPGQEAGRVHHTVDRKTDVYDGKHGFWRLCNYIPSVTYSGSADTAILRRTGEAFGEFRRQLADFRAFAEGFFSRTADMKQRKPPAAKIARWSKSWIPDKKAPLFRQFAGRAGPL